jgi:hypothetical protein
MSSENPEVDADPCSYENFKCANVIQDTENESNITYCDIPQGQYFVENDMHIPFYTSLNWKKLKNTNL